MRFLKYNTLKYNAFGANLGEQCRALYQRNVQPVAQTALLTGKPLNR
jgi:hypothetical protein